MANKIFMVIVHMPHKSIVCPFIKQSDAYQYFCKLLLEVASKYGDTDYNGASLEHCRRFGFYEIIHGYFLQMYEADIDSPESIRWLDISGWKR